MGNDWHFDKRKRCKTMRSTALIQSIGDILFPRWYARSRASRTCRWHVRLALSLPPNSSESDEFLVALLVVPEIKKISEH